MGRMAWFRETRARPPFMFRRPGAENCPLGIPKVCEKVRWLISVPQRLAKIKQRKMLT